MTTLPKTAMVLAAGLGTRMRPLTDHRPKPLVEVRGRALLDWTLDRFAAAGVETAVVNVHYFADMMEAHLARRARPRVVVSDERGLLLETGGGLQRARGLLGAAPIFCTNTDAILVDDPGGEACARLAAAFDPDSCDALLLLAPMARASGFDSPGDFDLGADGGLLWRSGASAAYAFTGLQILKPGLLDGAPEGRFSMRVLWDRAARAGRFRGLVHEGSWMHVGDPEGLRVAEERLGRLAVP